MNGLETVSVAKIQGEQQQELFEAIRHFAKFRAIGGLPNGIDCGERALDLHVDLMQLYEDLFEVKDE